MKNYYDRVHLWGRIWTVSALFFLLAVPLAMSLYLNAWPEGRMVIKALLSIIPLYWTTAIIEVVTYVPMLGAGGTYLCFVTGNISNLKLPCGLAAMENAKVRANSEEGEVISTLAIAVSAIVTTVIIAVGVIAFSPVLPKITAEGSPFKPAFEQVLPALFGALGASYFVKHWRICIVPIVTGVVTLVFAPTLQVGILMFVTIVLGMVFTHFYFKKTSKNMA